MIDVLVHSGLQAEASGHTNEHTERLEFVKSVFAMMCEVPYVRPTNCMPFRYTAHLARA